MRLLKNTALAPLENLQNLLFLRWFEIVGQIVILSCAQFFLGLAIPILAVSTIVIAQVMINLASQYFLKEPQQVNDKTFLFQLLTDVAGLSAILYFTGGATNAFAWVLLVPLAIASTLLPKFYSWLMAVVTSTAYSVLIFFFQPLLHQGHSMQAMPGEHFQQHIIGMWLGFVLVTFLMAYFVAGMANTLRLRDKLLANMREDALRDERLIALATLATSAAHELGTPLGTMDIIAHELELALAKDQNKAGQQQLGIIQQQIKRCKKVLRSITDDANASGLEQGQAIAINEYIKQVVQQWRVSHLEVNLQLSCQASQPAPLIISNAALTHALINVLDNAAKVSPQQLKLLCEWNSEKITITFDDYGPGMEEERLLNLGRSGDNSTGNGLGIGLYLTRSTLERLGGNITWRNRAEGGLSVCIQLPLGV